MPKNYAKTNKTRKNLRVKTSSRNSGSGSSSSSSSSKKPVARFTKKYRKASRISMLDPIFEGSNESNSSADSNASMQTNYSSTSRSPLSSNGTPTTKTRKNTLWKWVSKSFK